MLIKLLYLTTLLATTPVSATTEQIFLAKSIYHECREEAICSTKDWQRIAKVAFNRQQAYKTWKFGAKCRSISCIVRSKEYTSASSLGKPIKDKKVFEKIKKFVLAGQFGTSNYLFFSTKGKGKHRKMSYRGNLMKLIRDNK